MPGAEFDERARGAARDELESSTPMPTLGWLPGPWWALASQPKRATVLVVDHQGFSRRSLAESLSRAGYRVICAGTGEEAIEILWREKERVDWLFTGLDLPGSINGWRVAEEFRFAHPLRTVVFASDDPADPVKVGPRALLVTRPYRPAEIVAAFRGLNRESADGSCAVDDMLSRAESSSAEPKRSRCG